MGRHQAVAPDATDMSPGMRLGVLQRAEEWVGKHGYPSLFSKDEKHDLITTVWDYVGRVVALGAQRVYVERVKAEDSPEAHNEARLINELQHQHGHDGFQQLWVNAAEYAVGRYLYQDWLRDNEEEAINSYLDFAYISLIATAIAETERESTSNQPFSATWEKAVWRNLKEVAKLVTGLHLDYAAIVGQERLEHDVKPESKPLIELRKYTGLEHVEGAQDALAKLGITTVTHELTTEDGQLFAPSNPIVMTGLKGIWSGGKHWQTKGIWEHYPEHDTVRLIHTPQRGGRITLEVDTRDESAQAVWSYEKLDAYLQSLSPLTSDVGLAVLALLNKASQPMIEPVIISSSDIRQLKGLNLYGKQREEFDKRIEHEMDKLQRLVFDAHLIQAADPHNGRWQKRGISWRGDRLFDIIRIEQWQSSLFDNSRHQVAVQWSVRAGHWAHYFLSPRARRWVSSMAVRLFALSHRDDRRAEQLAKKIGQFVALNGWREGKGQPLKWTRRTLLESIGENIEAEPKPGRLMEALDSALELFAEHGVYKQVIHEPFTGKKTRGWISTYLEGSIEFVLFDDNGSKQVARSARIKDSKPRKAVQGPLNPGDIRRARENLDLNQSALAQELGISRQYLSELENGKRKPSKALAKKLQQLIQDDVSGI